MKKVITTALGVATLAIGAVCSPAEARIPSLKADPLRFMTPARAPQSCNAYFEAESRGGQLRAAERTPDKSLDMSEEMQFLTAPDGSTWFAVVKYDSETVELPGGYATEKRIKGFEYTIYDDNFNLIGTVKDRVHLGEGEVKVARVELAAQVTKKFFNVDDLYEVQLVSINNIANPYDYPAVHTYTHVYSIGGKKDADGNDTIIATIPGYSVCDINAAPDKFSEKFYITFLTEQGLTEEEAAKYPSYLDALAQYKWKLDTYKFAGWGGDTEVINSTEVPMLCLPGDQENSPCMLGFLHNGLPYYVFSQYEKSFFEDPTGLGGNENLTADNNLVVTAYTVASRSASAFTKISETKIPTVQDPANPGIWAFYGIGTFMGVDDVVFDHCDATEETPSFFVTRTDYSVQADDQSYAFEVYNTDGEKTATLAEYVKNYSFVSDVPGTEPQACFVSEDINAALFTFVEVYSGKQVMSLRSDAQTFGLSGYMDRVADGRGGYNYIFASRNGETTDDGNTHAYFYWYNPEAELVKTDDINMGQNIAIAMFNVNANVLNPYLFNTDSHTEYMGLVKRYLTDDPNDTRTREELIIISDDSRLLLNEGPTDQGGLVNIYVANAGTNPKLVLTRGSWGEYYQDFYNLPLERFGGGDGTADAPYLVTSIADLQQMSSAPGAHYALANDFDASGFAYEPVKEFTGTLDGRKHTISNLTLSRGSNMGLIATMQPGSAVKDLYLKDVTLEINDDSANAATVAATVNNATISGVHVYGLTVKAPESATMVTVAGIASKCTQGATIESCYVAGADINAPRCDVGGIAGKLMTSASVHGCAFSGTINGGTEVGGIAASTYAPLSEITDCHVNADITAQNTVGGVLGLSGRSIVARNYVQGTLTATTPNYYTNNLAAGGIIGHLNETAGAVAGEDVKLPEFCVEGNIVHLTSLTAPAVTATPEYAGQLNTVHRIIGYSILNAPGNNEEKGLKDNYAIAPLAPVDAASDATAAGVEGQQIIFADANKDFLRSLGWNHGTTSAEPWNDNFTVGNALANLHYEHTASLPADYVHATQGQSAEVHVKFDTPVSLTAAQANNGFAIRYDQSHLRLTASSYGNNVKSMTFEVLKNATSQIEIYAAGTKLTATVSEVSGVAAVTPATGTLTYDGQTLRAPGTITVYSLQGIAVAEGLEAINTDKLPHGAYIAVCGDSTLKFVK